MIFYYILTIDHSNIYSDPAAKSSAIYVMTPLLIYAIECVYTICECVLVYTHICAIECEYVYECVYVYICAI
jgi:hypothetical protein